MPVMIVRKFIPTAPKACDSLLPFLYQTKTIQGRSIRHINGDSKAASTEFLDGQDAEEQDSTVYKPNPHARRLEQNGAQDLTSHSKYGTDSGDNDGGTSSNGSTRGRRRTLYPSLLLPHERTEAAKRERAKQSVDELNDVLSSDSTPRGPDRYIPLHRERFQGQTGVGLRSDDYPRRRERRADAIPFAEGSTMGGSSDEVISTITPSERKVFEKLFKAGAASVLPSTEHEVKTTEERSLGKDKASSKRAVTRIERPAPQFPAALETMAKAAQLRVRTPRPPPEEIPRNADGVRESFSALHAQGRANSSISKMNRRMRAAVTDYDCWRIFTNQLGQYLGMLSPPDPADRQYMARLVSEILPVVLVSCTKILRDRFPGSTLALGVLPALKRAGPQAYATGCSTALYNAHMSILYNQYTDISAVVDVLQEMDQKVFPFDDETHAILDKILYDARGVKLGIMENLSPAIMMLWSTERMQRAVRDVEKWRDVVEERRQNEALRVARQKDELDEAAEREGTADSWMLKEGEYLSFRRKTEDSADGEEGAVVRTRRKGRELEIQEKVDTLMPEVWKEDDGMKRLIEVEREEAETSKPKTKPKRLTRDAEKKLRLAEKETQRTASQKKARKFSEQDQKSPTSSDAALAPVDP